MTADELRDELAHVRARLESLVGSRLLSSFGAEEEAIYRTLVVRETQLLDALRNTRQAEEEGTEAAG